MATVNSISTSNKKKGKGKATEYPNASGLDSGSESSDVTTTSDSEASPSSDSEDEITEEFLASLLQRARENAAAVEAEQPPILEDEEEILTLDDVESPPLPKLDPGDLLLSYLQIGEARDDSASVLDLKTAETMKQLSSRAFVSPPIPPPELIKAGKAPTRREKKELRKQTAGPDWFDMPAPAEADLPHLHREVEALRLRNQLDPKRFYRKDEGEGKGVKGLPKYFTIGKIVATESPFGGSGTNNLPRSQRKRTLVDELVDDAEARRYAKKKFNELQSVRGAKGKNTLRVKQALRKPKW